MKSFKKYIVELYTKDEISTEDVKPDYSVKYGDTHEIGYVANIEGNKITTKIRHNMTDNTARVIYDIDGNYVRPFGSERKTSDYTAKVIRSVASHIKHHIDNYPEKVTKILYQASPKKDKIYKRLGSMFGVEVENKSINQNKS